MDILRPQLAFLLQGRKQVHTATQTLECVAGDLFLVTRRCRIDVVNTPDPHSGIYLTAVIRCAKKR